MSRSFHMRVNVEHLLCMSVQEFWRDWKSVFEDDNGKVLTCKEARDELRVELEKGHKVIPVGTCDNFDYSGKGCLGHEEPKKDGKENIPSYIGRLKCGCVVAACVDDPDSKHPEDTREFIKDFIDQGLILERVTVGWVREHGLEKCKDHKDKPEQLSLLGCPVIIDPDMPKDEMLMVNLSKKSGMRLINIGGE